MPLDRNDAIVREIITARVKLLFEKPFYGQLAARLIIEDASSWCETAATDGRHFYFNRNFIKGLTKAQLCDLICDLADQSPKPLPAQICRS